MPSGSEESEASNVTGSPTRGMLGLYVNAAAGGWLGLAVKVRVTGTATGLFSASGEAIVIRARWTPAAKDSMRALTSTLTSAPGRRVPAVRLKLNQRASSEADQVSD